MSAEPYRQNLRPSLLGLLAAACALLVVACQPQSPEQRVIEARSQYVVELNSWFPQEKPPEPIIEEVTEDGESGDDATANESADSTDAVEGGDADSEMEGEIMMIEPVGPRPVDIFLDLIVRFDGEEPLPGITLDVSQVNAAGEDKNSWRHFLEIPTIIKSETKQVSFTLEDVLFEEGDQFSVVLAKSVDPAERGEYREFAASGE